MSSTGTAAGFTLAGVFAWLSGGNNRYPTLVQSLNGDTRLATVLVALCTAIGVGYVVIAYRWFSQSRKITDSEAKRALNAMVKIFVLSAVCGYFWPLIKIKFPFWRLQAFMLAVLCGHVWGFILRPNYIRAIARVVEVERRIVARNDAALETIQALKERLGGDDGGEWLARA